MVRTELPGFCRNRIVDLGLPIMVCLTTLSLAICLGCGENVSDAGKTDPTDVDVATRLAAATENAARSNLEFNQLTTEARELERQFQFAAAAGVWDQLVSAVEQRYGASSWQARNAQIAHAAAVRKSQFNNGQTEQLAKLAALMEQTKIKFQKNDIEQALALSLDCLPLQSELFGVDSIEIGQAMIQIGTLEGQLDAFDQATRHLHDGIQILAGNNFGDHPELELAHATLADLYAGQDKFVPAIANQAAATEIAGNVWGPDSLNFANQANQLGVIYHRAGELDVALKVLNSAKVLRQRLLGTNDPAFAHSCLNLGVVLLDKQQLADAEELFQKAMSIFQEQFGLDDPLTLNCKSQIATIFMLRKQPALAEPLLDEVVRSMTRATEPNVEQLLSHEYRLAVTLARQGKYDRAQPLIQSVIGRQQNLFGLSDRRTIASLRAYALMLESTHHAEAAAQIKQQINRTARMRDSNDFQPRY